MRNNGKINQCKPILWDLEKCNEKPREYIKTLSGDIESDDSCNHVLYYNRALTLCEVGEFENSLEDFSRAIRLCSDDADYWCHRGLAYFSMKRFVPALQDITKSIQIKPRARYFNDRAIMYQKMGDFKLALENFNEAISREKCCSVFLINRALLFKEMKNYRSSVEDFTQSIEMNDKNPVAYNNRATVYILLGQPNKALDDLNHLIEEVLDINPYVYNNRGLVNFILGRFNNAIKDYNVAITFMKEASTFFKRGVSYLRIGNYEKARTDFEKVLELDPDVYKTQKENEFARFKGGVDYQMKMLEIMEEESGKTPYTNRMDQLEDEDEEDGEDEEMQDKETIDFVDITQFRKRNRTENVVEENVVNKRRKKLSEHLD